MLLVGGPAIEVHQLTLEGGFPFRFADNEADVVFREATFQAKQWRREVIYAELYATRRDEFWSSTAAVRRAKDEVLAALFDLQQSEARSVDLSTYLRLFKQKTVLLLGDFRTGRTRLEHVREALGRVGYRAVLLDEIPEEPNYDLPQKFQAVAAVCRFLVFEDSTAAGQIYEMALAEGLRSVRIVLREGEEQSTFMTRAIGLTSTVHREWTCDADSLESVVAEAVTWAEKTLAELAQERSLAYPWRDPA
jgi:hypothetical protein